MEFLFMYEQKGYELRIIKNVFKKNISYKRIINKKGYGKV